MTAMMAVAADSQAGVGPVAAESGAPVAEDGRVFPPLTGSCRSTAAPAPNGRFETRTCHCPARHGLAAAPPRLARLEGLRREPPRERNQDRARDPVLYHLAAVAGRTGCPGVRDHWAVENSLHWVMDVIFRNDECRVRNDNAPADSAVISIWHTTSSARLPVTPPSAQGGRMG